MAADYFDRYVSVLNEVREFNDRQLSQFDASPRGVGWNSTEAQVTRFEQVLKVVEPNAPKTATLNDIGCGYGALIEHMASKNMQLDYRGYDASDKMLAIASDLHRKPVGHPIAFRPLRDITAAAYSVASGMFGLRFGHDDQFWHTYVRDSLDLFNEHSSSGFAFNMLTSYSDAHKKRDELYYADPCVYFDLCKRRYSKNVALYHDYSLFDFTIIVRKN